MNEINEFDYTVTKKAEGTYLLKRVLMIIGYVLFGLIFFFGLYILHLYQFIAFIILVEWIVVFFTWRYVSIEYLYETASGKIRFFNVYGGKKKKQILDLKIKDIKEISPISENKRTFLPNNTYSFLSSEKCEYDHYYAIFINEKGDECIVHFEATQKALKILQYYNPKTVITTTRY